MLSFQLRAQLRPEGGEFLQGVEQEVGAGGLEDVVGQGAGVATDGEGAGIVAAAYAERRVLHHHALPRLHLCLAHRHQIGLGVGLALADIKARNHEVGMEKTRIIVVEALEERVLTAAGDEADLQTIAPDLAKQLQGAGHRFGGRQLIVVLALAGVDAIHLLLIGGAMPLAAGEQIHCGEAGAPLVEIDIHRRHAEAEIIGGLHPCLGMMGHGIIQNAVHIKEYGLEPCVLKAIFLKICGDIIFYRSHLPITVAFIPILSPTLL